MPHFTRVATLTVATLTVATLLVAACADPTTTSVSVADDASLNRKPGEPGAAADRMLYQVRLDNVGDSRSHGVILIEVVGGYLTVTAHASGLAPTTDPSQPQYVPQHIHLNPGCASGGGILLNLDANLTVPGEGSNIGSAYPTANRGGVMNYYASRSLDDLRQAVNQYRNLNLATTAELLAWLNLDERNAHMHFTGPFHAVNCGEVTRLN